MKKTTSPYIIVKKSEVHGVGLYAKKDIPEGTQVIEYVGDKVTKAESHRRADKPLDENVEDSDLGAVYLFQLNKRYDIDGYVKWNTARYINHSCDPNCETDIIRGKIWIIAIRDIKKDEELFYNYGYDYDSYEDHQCRCRAVQCMGYILAEEHWPALKRKRTIARKKKMEQQTA